MACPASHLPLFLRALADPLSADCVETSLSWVLLTAQHAFKIKKPVHLPYVDYSTLEARRHFCEEEVRVNRTLAAILYLGVVPITGPAESPSLGGTGPVLEWAVQMHRIAPGALFSEQLADGLLGTHDVDALAQLISRFHLHAPRQPWPPGVRAMQRHRALAALDSVHGLASRQQLDELTAWIDRQAVPLQPLWEQRGREGRVRECHGDLHLDNIVSYQGAVLAFDALEFNDALRWIDIIDDAAFAMMDFSARGHAGLGWRFMNGWFDETGDHGALLALRFSLVYRALVRSGVEHLRKPGSNMAQRYLLAALGWTVAPRPRLLITFGLPASGKTTAAGRIAETDGALRLRSDVERKRLYGLQALRSSREAGLDLYTEETSAATYGVLLEKAELALAAGWSVVIDAAFLRRAERERAFELAARHGIAPGVLACEAPDAVLRQRLANRRGDASEANEQVLVQLRAQVEPLTPAERACLVPQPPLR